ncbi:hypothetical protein Purlil1_12473 [Purpureocillium lilacinum]|uniref:Uncharacterized protein n=1 Tax=Purpureocillium lilacinum TaxID=33203 RepID=A0ABR0BGS1_PURLI|nr:hypothetical protein Purlil1_12473 [Purpureocillium lilacinum]
MSGLLSHPEKGGRGAIPKGKCPTMQLTIGRKRTKPINVSTTAAVPNRTGAAQMASATSVHIAVAPEKCAAFTGPSSQPRSRPNERDAPLPRGLDMASNQSLESIHYPNSKAVNQDAEDDYFLGTTSKDVHNPQFGNANCLTTELKGKSTTASQSRNRGNSNSMQSQPLLTCRLRGADADAPDGTQAAEAVLALERFKEHCGNSMQTEVNALERLLLDLASAI